MAKMSKAMLRWRAEQKRGKIMKPSTFADIEASERAKGLSPERAKKAAGAAYWRAAMRKYTKARRK